MPVLLIPLPGQAHAKVSFKTQGLGVSPSRKLSLGPFLWAPVVPVIVLIIELIIVLIIVPIIVLIIVLIILSLFPSQSLLLGCELQESRIMFYSIMFYSHNFLFF